MYTVTTSPSQSFASFCAAIEVADAAKVDILDENGMRRWTPGKVDARAQARYVERKAAYDARVRRRDSRL